MAVVRTKKVGMKKMLSFLWATYSRYWMAIPLCGLFVFLTQYWFNGWPVSFGIIAMSLGMTIVILPPISFVKGLIVRALYRSGDSSSD